MPRTATPFGRYSEQVEWMIKAGQPLASVEQTIDSAPLPEDDRDALWLIAWSLAQRVLRPPPSLVALSVASSSAPAGGGS
ncbi:MAG: hypothetical protein ACJ768_03600 [Gaiellaceae bacterium]